MLTKLFKITPAMLFLLLASQALASEPVYVGDKRFLPLPQAAPQSANKQSQQDSLRFFPLVRSHSSPNIKIPVKRTIDSKIPPIPRENITPPVPEGKSPSKDVMPVAQAQQILSIFAGNQ